MDEYDEFEAGLYDRHSNGLRGDIAFYVDEARRCGSPVLEMGCGTGRILIPTAEAGLQITGLDRSVDMLARARKKIAQLACSVQEQITLIDGDMREYSQPNTFRLITIPYRAFLHLLTVEDQRRALIRVRENLVPGGYLVLNIFDPRIDIIYEHHRPLGSAMKMEFEFIHETTGRRVVAWDTRQYNQETQILEQYFIYEELDENGAVVAKTYRPLKLRYVFRFEMQHLLELSGFEIEALYGSFTRHRFRTGGEQIWIARRR